MRIEPDAGSGIRVGLYRDSERWVRALESEGKNYEDACARLHALLLRIARSEIARRRGSHHVTGPELDDLAHQASADALLAIVRKIGQFCGESKFTTWACAFVMLEVSGKLGRHFWRNAGVALEHEDWDRLPDRLGLDPAVEAEARELLEGRRKAQWTTPSRSISGGSSSRSWSTACRSTYSLVHRPGQRDVFGRVSFGLGVLGGSAFWVPCRTPFGRSRRSMMGGGPHSGGVGVMAVFGSVEMSSSSHRGGSLCQGAL